MKNWFKKLKLFFTWKCPYRKICPQYDKKGTCKEGPWVYCGKYWELKKKENDKNSTGR